MKHSEYTAYKNGALPIESQWFYSPEDILAAPIAIEGNGMQWHTSQKESVTSSRWWGEGGRDAALKRIQHGWPEGLELFHKMMEDISNLDSAWPEAVIRRRRQRIWADSGNELDIHRVNSGHVDNAWRSHRFENKTAHGVKHVTVLVNFAVNASTKSDEFLWRGALAAVLCERLQALGKTIRIVAYDPGESTYGSDYGVQGVTLKEYNSPAVLERLAGYFTVAFLRYHIFKAILSHPTRRASAGLGRAVRGELAEKILPYPIYEEQQRQAATLVVVRDTLSLSDAREEMDRIKNQIQQQETQS